MDLDNGNRFCITKNISLLKKDFSRGWCFSIFDFGNFYAKPLFSMSLISMKNPKIVIFWWFYPLFSLIKSSCVTTFNAKYLVLYQIQDIRYLYFLNKAFFKFLALSDIFSATKRKFSATLPSHHNSVINRLALFINTANVV